MRRTLFVSGVLCASLLTGCSSAPKLPVPSGDWEDLPMPRRPLSNSAVPSTAVAASYPGTGFQPAPGSPTQPVPGSGSPGALKVAVSTAVATPAAAPALGAVATAGMPPAPGAAASAVSAAATRETPSVAPTKVFSPAPATPVPAVVAPTSKPIKPVPPPPPPKPVWEARQGESLQQVVERWSQAVSPVPYKVDWLAVGLDYPIDAPLRFQGTFEEAVLSLFQLYEKAERPFAVDGRRSQHRLIVSEDLDRSRRTKK